MKNFQLRKSLVLAGMAAIMGCGAAIAQTSAISASGTTGIDNTGNAASERQACLTGRTQQDRATCLREVTNANAEKRQGKLSTQGDLTANALARCSPLQGTDRVACEARVLGYGGADGSVAGGGMIKEVEIISVPADPNQPVRVEPQTDSPVILTVPAQ